MQGILSLIVTNMDTMIQAFKGYYGSFDDDDVNMDAYHSAGGPMEHRRSETTDDYVVRMRSVQDLIPITRASDTDFVERMVKALSKPFPAVMLKMRKHLRVYRELHQDLPLPLNEFRELLRDESHELSSVPLELYQPRGDNSAEMESLKAKLVACQSQARNYKTKSAAMSSSSSKPPPGGGRTPRGPPGGRTHQR